MIGLNGGHWDGLDGLGEQALRELRAPAEQAVKKVLVRFEGEMKRTLTGVRHGRPYKVSKGGPLHIAAAPGEPPAVLRGNLRNSVGHTGPEWDGWTVSGEVGPGLGTPPAGGEDPGTSYALLQEYGGIVKGVRHYPHPYVAPTALRMEPIIDAEFARFGG